ncbi:hypothetical protein LTR12_014787 [Friedmanniomyces endolithicus]|nr:hypothetical protein LTR74_016526 [Friedmanniomyces endolithicus]KAK1810828.1 hypothetical protein LTR12_014787 [Friedmanniomyces endolithicus]
MKVAPSNGPVAVPRDSEGLHAYNESPRKGTRMISQPKGIRIPGPTQAYEDKGPIQAYGDGNPDVRGYATSPHAMQPGYQAIGVDEDRTHKRRCGLRPVTFWLSAALVFALVALGAIAGGLGTGMKSANDRAIYWYVEASPLNFHCGPTGRTEQR